MNVALDGTATQSSEFQSASFPAGNAIDGDFTNFTHTNSDDDMAWWEISWATPQLISSIVLHNRDIGQQRLRDITVEIFDPQGNLLEASPLLNPGNSLNGPPTLTFEPTVVSAAGRLRVSRTSDPGGSDNNDSNVLSLSEVEVFAATDQRGLARPVDLSSIINAVGGNGSDIGAYEAQETPGLVVTTIDDVVDETDQLTSLREAIDFANNLPGADTITFDPTVFTGGNASLIRLSGTELEITDTLTIDGSTGTDVTITGDANGDDVTLPGNITDVAASLTAGVLGDNSRVLRFSASTGDLTLQGVSVTGGRTTGARFEDGGGIRFDSSDTLTITSSTVSGNSTSGSFCRRRRYFHVFRQCNSLTSSTVSGNASVFGGGGIASSSGAVTLTSSAVSGYAAAGLGGGISGVSVVSV